MNTTEATDHRLKFERDGFIFPIPVLNQAEVSRCQTEIDHLEDHYGCPLPPASVIQPHIHFPWAWELAHHPKVLAAVETILGPDILVHSSSIFKKHPQKPGFISWHQDGYYWQLNPPLLVTAWMALTESTQDNGCMRVFPGSHKKGNLPHREIRHADNMLGTGLTLIKAPETPSVALELKPGTMSMHHLDLVHGSGANQSNGVRTGFAVRYVHPSVQQQLPHHGAFLARGFDIYGHFKLLQEPPRGDFLTCVRNHDHMAKDIRKQRKVSA